MMTPLQRKYLHDREFIEEIAKRMQSAGPNNWAYNDMHMLCELAGMLEQWLNENIQTYKQEQILAMAAAEVLGVDIGARYLGW